MMRFCALAGFALAVSLAPWNSSTGAPVKNAPVKNAPAKNGHAHHLLKAEEDLVSAESSIASANLAQAHKHVAAAIKQLEEAIAHHHKHHIAQSTTGNGAIGNIGNRARHHHHHATLKQALAELFVAEKELKAGAGAQASKEIAKAAKTIQNAVTSHHHLFGKA